MYGHVWVEKYICDISSIFVPLKESLYRLKDLSLLNAVKFVIMRRNIGGGGGVRGLVSPCVGFVRNARRGGVQRDGLIFPR